MKNLQNEKGNASLYLLWIFGIFSILFVPTINIVKIYVVKEHANLAVEQAALAGTSVLLDKTKEAIDEFENSSTLDPFYIADRVSQLSMDSGKSVSELIDEKKNDYISGGMEEGVAYVKAMNKILPDRIDQHPYLKKELKDKLGLTSTDMYYIFSPTVQNIIGENKGLTDETKVKFTSKWQIEVKSAVKFETIFDNKYISQFIYKVPQKGYGPALKYLENIYL
ncbi:hypothetical protein ACNQFZ_09725 [Schinkia sp. CFF1]